MYIKSLPQNYRFKSNREVEDEGELALQLYISFFIISSGKNMGIKTYF